MIPSLKYTLFQPIPPLGTESLLNTLAAMMSEAHQNCLLWPPGTTRQPTCYYWHMFYFNIPIPFCISSFHHRKFLHGDFLNIFLFLAEEINNVNIRHSSCNSNSVKPLTNTYSLHNYIFFVPFKRCSFVIHIQRKTLSLRVLNLQ